MKAVVFDFFGTLTDPAGRRASFTATAEAPGVPADDFCATMANTFGERATGAMRPILATNANYPTAAAYRDDPAPYVPDLAVDEVSSILTVACEDHSCP